MICSYQKIILNDSAKEYFIRTLEYGHELDKQILDKINSFKGDIYTYLPQKHSPSDRYQFEGGGVAGGRKSIECISIEIYNHIIKNNENICILEDALCHPSDGFSKKCEKYLMIFNDEVYFCIDKNANVDDIKDIIMEAEQPNFFICVLSSNTQGVLPVSRNNLLSSAEINNIVERSEKVILGAYDGEGYLIWEKYNGPQK